MEEVRHVLKSRFSSSDVDNSVSKLVFLARTVKQRLGIVLALISFDFVSVPKQKKYPVTSHWVYNKIVPI